MFRKKQLFRYQLTKNVLAPLITLLLTSLQQKLVDFSLQIANLTVAGAKRSGINDGYDFLLQFWSKKSVLGEWQNVENQVTSFF